MKCRYCDRPITIDSMGIWRHTRPRPTDMQWSLCSADYEQAAPLDNGLLHTYKERPYKKPFWKRWA